MEPSVTVEVEVLLDPLWQNADPNDTVMTVLTATGVESLTAAEVGALSASM